MFARMSDNPRLLMKRSAVRGRHLRKSQAALAQLVEHIIRNDGVRCSSHLSGTTPSGRQFPGTHADARKPYCCAWVLFGCLGLTRHAPPPRPSVITTFPHVVICCAFCRTLAAV